MNSKLNIVTVTLCCLIYLIYGQGTIQIGRGNQLSSQQIEDLEKAYEKFVKSRRVQNVNGAPRRVARTRTQGVSSSDIQNDELLAYADIVMLGTVNFNRKIVGVVKGDVIPNPGEAERTTPPPTNSSSSRLTVRRLKRKAIATEFNVVEKWDDGILFYRVITSAFTDPASVRAKIRKSLTPIEDNSCIKFTEILPTQTFGSDKSLIEVKDNLGCASTIGRVPGKSQTMSLAPGCHVTGTIQHEFMHALGFGHEHERPDRDSFVAINSRYIQQEYIANFDKEPFPTYSTDIPYDLSSIMHYSQNQFSLDLSSNTIELTDPYLAISALDIGQRIGFSWLDEVILNKYYSCEKDCTITCENGGYVRKLTTGVCQCFCPPGLSGSTCTEVVNPCGKYVDLSLSNGESVITSQNFDGSRSFPSNDICYFFIKGPGYLELTFTHFDITCDNYLEIRSFHISQPTLGLCGDTEPAPVRTIYSPTPGMLMLIYDTTKSTQGERGWSLTAKSHTDACLKDPCHGAKCTPVPGSDTQYICEFPKHPMHCDFDQGRLGACSRIKFNKYYQDPGDFQLAWQVSSNSNSHMLTSSDVTERLQRGIASVVPHDFTGKQWCFAFKYRINGDDEATINLHLVKNGKMDATSIVFTKTDDRISFYAPQSIDIDGRQYADSDMVELVFEVLYTDVGPRIDTVDIDSLHLIPQPCPAKTDACASFPCGERDCVSPNNAAVCLYPDTDIHCGFEASENGCQADVEYFGKFHSHDDSDWTLYSGATLTADTGPDKAAVGEGYLYVESNFPPIAFGTSIRSSYLRMAPRKSANRCLAFRYHMFGSAVVRLEVQASIYDSFIPSVRRLWVVHGNQGNEWKFQQVDVNINDRLDSVKIQVEIIAKGRSKFSDIAIDDIHLTKGACDRSPVNGKWSEWGSYGDCSTTCGTGTKTRTRSCVPPINGGIDCVGSTSDTATCEVSICVVDGVLSDWTEWSTCPVTCGGGIATRSRSCTPPQGTGAACPPGELNENQSCGTDACIVNGIWQEWTSWGDCSVTTCGSSGQQTRQRPCTPPQNNGLPCVGNSNESKSCNTAPCVPVIAVVGDWSQWTNCSKPCGTGQRQRTRSCITQGTNGGITCEAMGLSASEDCNSNGCPKDATVSNWGTWSICSKTCGNGVRTRQRTCETQEENGGRTCTQLGLSEEGNCIDKQCPTDAQVSDWSGWSGCSITCGDGGQITRSRTCIIEAQNGGVSCTDKGLSETNTCDSASIIPCSQDAILSSWTDWTQCPVSCGGGKRNRERTCITEAQGGGKSCSEFDLLKENDCNTNRCPIDGILSQWATWSTCSVTCGEGQSQRSRVCSIDQHGGVSCLSANLLESKPCFVEPDCQIDGVLTEWTDWSACSVSCDEGIQSRSRDCTLAQNGGNDCGDSLLLQSKSCTLEICPVDGKFTDWTPWEECSESCGTGTRSRARNCIEPQHGGLPCDGELTDQGNCNTQPCIVDGVWKPWSSWVCSVTCGTGIEERQRECDGPFNGGQDCVGDSQQTKQCQASINNCPVDSIEGDWGTWSSCSATCGKGSKNSIRTCVLPQFGGKVCGELERTAVCQIRNCPINGVPFSWSNWGSCSVTCGTGSHTRTRVCSNPRFGGRPCTAHLAETEICTGILLSCITTYNQWQQWTGCSATCGTAATRTRRRTCRGNALCDGVDQIETHSCNQFITCSKDGFYLEWAEWNSCSVTCGNGVQKRQRTCVPPVGNGKPCTGEAEESQNCSFTCVVDGLWQEWTNWGQCSTTCGPGNLARSRICTPPINGGAACPGSASEIIKCEDNPSPCVDDGFGPWSDWSFCGTSSCSRTSSNPRAFQTRQRRCIRSCGFGRTFEIQRCTPDCGGSSSTSTTTPTTTTTTPTTTTSSGRRDGNWGDWVQWTECEQPCKGQRRRGRVCDSPIPQPGGAHCPGIDFEAEDCTNAPNCNELIGGGVTKICQGFEDSTNIQTYGQPTTNDFSIRSGPSSLYFTGELGRTGPNWAKEGKNYLLFSASSPRRQDFKFLPEFNFTDGACLKFQYSTHGRNWNGATLEIALLSLQSNRFSQAMWKHSAENHPHWQSAEISIPKQNFLFQTSRLVLTINGGGQLSDLGLDDLQLGEKTCDKHLVEICPTKTTPPTRSCGFEKGDDCSWIERNVPGNSGAWKVWRGSTPNSNTGPTSAVTGSNYIYTDTGSTLGLQISGSKSFRQRNRGARGARRSSLVLKALGSGQGCLEFSYHLQGPRQQFGMLTVQLSNGRRIFRTTRGRGSRWTRRRIDVSFQGSNSNQNQILIQYRTRSGNSQKDLALDNIEYRANSRCA